MLIKKPVTTIFFAPPAAGKTSSIIKLKQVNNSQANNSFVHFDLDQSVEKLVWENSQSCAGIKTAIDHRLLRFCTINALRQHLTDLWMEFARETPHIIIDYPTPRANLVEVVIGLSHEAGRSVVLEGITANPQNILPRLLERRSEGKDLPDALAGFIQEQQASIPDWLKSFKFFPEKFLALAKKVETARLRDNNNGAMQEIAQWKNGESTIVDFESYQDFERLAEITHEAATFEARYIGPFIGEFDRHLSAFEARPIRFFGAEKPGYKLNAKGPDITP